MDYQHIPVLLEPALAILKPQPGKNFVDCTLGGGGYSTALLDAVAPDGRVLSIDLDADALEQFTKRVQNHRSVTAHGNFRDIDTICERHDFRNIAGIVADIGLSSYQLDTSGRGISFQRHEPLDMRFDLSSQEPDAQFMLNEYTEQELALIFTEYGEDRESRRIARAVVRARADKRIHYTTDFVAIIKATLPKPVQHKWQDTARRLFQALRIVVNHELENLEAFLPKAFDVLNPGGTLVVVTFHSLEDRIVKQYFQSLARGCVCPLEFPVCRCGREPQGRLLTKRPVLADETEMEANPRSKPAKLRAIIKS